jgi:peptidoglycan hydrolase CwlO-like protein
MDFRKKLFFILLILFLSYPFARNNSVLAQTETPTPSSTPTPTSDPTTQTSSIQDCSSNHISVADCPSYLQNKVDELSKQETTLSSQIDLMDSQIKLTQARIEATKEEILSLGEDIDTAQKKIATIEASLSSLTKILVTRLVTGYEVGSQGNFQLLLAANSISDFFTRENYLRIVERYDKRLIYDTMQAKNDYANQKQIFEEKKKKIIALKSQLENYTDDLNNQKKAKQSLLTQTQGSEENYQKLLSQAKAQLAGFQGFAISQGGASILNNQTYCDSWGCYYNQRDSQWGPLSLNHTQYTIASDGCLITSMAMVFTHYGHKDVTPIAINANASNFASYYPAYLLYTISANGATAERIGSYIDATLSGGNPVVVGIKYGNGDTHFVVLKSGSNGNYTMNDPFTPNGHDISFTSKYTIGSIFEVDKVVFM